MNTDDRYRVTVSSDWFHIYESSGMADELVSDGLIIEKETKTRTTLNLSAGHLRFFIDDITRNVEWCELEASDKARWSRALARFENADLIEEQWQRDISGEWGCI
jgi:hypothetical protein